MISDKMKLIIYLRPLIPVFVIVICISSCVKEPMKIMEVANDSITDITSTSAIVHSTIVDIGLGIDQYGHCWSTNADPTIDANEDKTEKGARSSTGSYSSLMAGLSYNTKYYVRAYIKNSSTVIYSDDILSFQTLAIGLPAVTTGSFDNITASSAVISGNLDDFGSGASSVLQYGHCWSNETTTPTIGSSKTSLGFRDATGAFESTLVGLSQGTLYYVRAYATNDAGTSYGNLVSFTTTQAVTVPVVTTASISSITESSAVSGGEVTSDGGATVTARGVCWNATGNATLSDSYTNDGSGPGSFTSDITGLSYGTTYYVRAYATNSAGTAYGNQVSFTAGQEVTSPVVTTASISSITQSSAVSGGEVISDGGATVAARGVCWNTTGNPIISDNHTTDGSGTGSFTSNITGLSSNTFYYVRAYATNSAGTAYGNQVSFTAGQDATYPVVATLEISSITYSSAVSGGDVTSDGGETVTARGVCWNTTGNPMISDDHTADGSGTGSFTSNITGLSTFTTYYVRAYATNSAGTAYGEQLDFKTKWDNSSISDYDGNVYSTVQIGEQIWMAENLKTTRFNDGSVIPLVTDNTAWSILTSSAYCWYNNNEATYKNPYGALYTWYAVKTNKLCPAGWSIPTDAEWTTLTSYLGGEDEAGGQLKETGYTHWNSPNTGATNETYFTALPGGHRYRLNGTFYDINRYGYWWSSSEDETQTAWGRNIYYDASNVYRDYYFKNEGFSVRCIKD
jgi:uncharacterized protein (TIGR02145 family)